MIYQKSVVTLVPRLKVLSTDICLLSGWDWMITMMQPGLHLQVLNDFIKVNGSSEGGSFFLGSRYSYAETVTTPFLVRAITVPARVGKYDVHESIKAHGLDRLGSWVEVSLAEASEIFPPTAPPLIACTQDMRKVWITDHAWVPSWTGSTN